MAQTKAQLIDGKGAVDLGALSISGSAPDNSVNLDSSGRLLVGTSAARSNFFNISYTPFIQFEGANSQDKRSISLVYGINALPGPHLILAKHRSDSVGGITIVNSQDQVGEINFQASDGTEFIPAATIGAEVDGTPGANDMPGRLVFSTTADGASSPTERMRINQAGDVFVGKTSASVTTAGVLIKPNGTSEFIASGNENKPMAIGSADDITLTLVTFHGASATPGGSISISSGTSVAFNTSSDYRLKENITSVADGITRLQQLKPSRFNFIADPDRTVDGFIAHEVQAVVPEAITGEKDAVDDEGNPVYQGIDQSKLVPLLTAALQETIGKIESLKARVAALEAQ